MKRRHPFRKFLLLVALFQPFYQFVQGGPLRSRLIHGGIGISVSYCNTDDHLLLLREVQSFFDIIIKSGDEADRTGSQSQAMGGEDQVSDKEPNIGQPGP